MGVGSVMWGIALPLAGVAAVQSGSLTGAMLFGLVLALFVTMALAAARR